MTEPRPIARVEDATLVDDGGPARLALSHLPRSAEISAAVAAARGVSRRVDGRLVVTAVPDRLVDAAGRVGGAELADLVRATIEPAIAAWRAPTADLVTAAGPLETGSRPLVMGIVNVTPDSFSDGGALLDDDHPRTAVAAGEAMLAAGADILDVGGESTRPGADDVDADTEIRRVIPVAEALAGAGAIVSIDTAKAVVAREAVAAGAVIVNDISAGRFDEDLLAAVAELGTGYVLMHMQGTPRTMQDDPTYGDVVGDVVDFLATRLDELVAGGIAADHVAVDPGIGFGKTAAHNLTLLRRARELTSLGRPLLIGASRKAFLRSVADAEDPQDRLGGSLAAAILAVGGGARIVRAHDVPATVQAVSVAHAIAGG